MITKRDNKKGLEEIKNTKEILRAFIINSISTDPSIADVIFETMEITQEKFVEIMNTDDTSFSELYEMAKVISNDNSSLRKEKDVQKIK